MWVRLTWKDAVDLIIVAALFYAFLLLLRRTHARFIVNVIGGLLVLYAMARFLNLYLTRCLVPWCDGVFDELLPSREE